MLTQVFGQNRFGLQLKSGVSISTQAYYLNHLTPTVKGNHNTVSGVLNISATYRIKNKIGVSSGLQIIEKGFNYSVRNVGSGTSTVFSTDYQYALRFLEIPVNFYYDKNRFGILIGFIVSYMYDNDYRYRDVTITTKPGRSSVVFKSDYYGSYPIKDRFKKWDFGINLGLVYRISEHFGVEITVQKHFIKLDKFAPKYGYSDIMYNQCYLFGIVYKITRAGNKKI